MLFQKVWVSFSTSVKINYYLKTFMDEKLFILLFDMTFQFKKIKFCEKCHTSLQFMKGKYLKYFQLYMKKVFLLFLDVYCFPHLFPGEEFQSFKQNLTSLVAFYETV